MRKTSSQIVQAQVDAYNSHDLDRFCSFYSENIQAIKGHERKVVLNGIEEFKSTYKKQFLKPSLKAEIVNRICLGDTVVDHEKVYGLQDEIVEVIAIYRIEEDLIKEVLFL